MATIMSLPDEVIVIILKKLSINDIENFSSTCKKFKETAWGNELWRLKFNQRWPIMKKIYDSIKNEDRCQIDFKEQLKENGKFAKEMWELVSHMYMDKMSDDDKRNLILNFLRVSMSTNYYLIADEFERIFSQPVSFIRESGQDLTQRYYGRFIFRVLRHYRTRYKYLKFKNGPKEQQFLERMVTIVVQWFRPEEYISYSYIEKVLDKIARSVLRALRNECPTHPIFAMANEYIVYWKDNNIDYSYWDYEKILLILVRTKEIIFSQKYFSTLNQLWLNLNDFQNVNCIRAGSQSILLLTIYHSVMRRFGIYSFVMTDKELHIFLKPKEYNNTRKEEYFCLVLEDGQFSVDNTIRTDHRRRHHFLIIRKLFSCLKELRTLHEKELIMLIDMLLGKHIDISDTMMLYITKIPRKIFSEARSAKIKFVIGTIVTHNCTHNRTHIGVIVGWNLYYKPSTLGINFNVNFNSNRPILNSNILCRNLKCADSTCCTHKPYYAIFCEHNMYCYIEQENVSKYDSPKWIVHDRIGQYFCRYEGNYYIPNKMLARDYPSDIAIINEMKRNQ